MSSAFEIIVPNHKHPVQAERFFGRRIPPGHHDLAESAPQFEMNADLARAVNVALSVGQPLLLTGEPGTGKTQLAYFLAWTFGAADKKPYVLPVKSTTTSRDLLYSFDTVAYFRTQAEDVHDKEKQFLVKGPLWRAFEDLDKCIPAVVLIDEIDKAPRDFPNDLLFELDQFEFRVPELNKIVKRQNKETPPPFVVITSNNERRLPDPFLRRTIFHHIEFQEDIVRKAVHNRKKELPNLTDDLIEKAIRHLMKLRENKRVRKPPATAEFLAWMRVLDTAQVDPKELDPAVPLHQLPFLVTLIKDREDWKALR
ncbi:MAG: MoxR family ATPase [Myxococcales bacterium]|nr:MoxR family ATPase [Myxococcales bacterium]